MQLTHTDVKVDPGPTRGRLPGSLRLSRQPALPDPHTRPVRSAEQLAKRQGCWGGQPGEGSSACEDRGLQERCQPAQVLGPLWEIRHVDGTGLWVAAQYVRLIVTQQ